MVIIVPTDPLANDRSILRRIVSGVAWTYVAHLGGRLAVFVGLALTARVLTPRDFGLFAMAMTVVSFLEIVRGFGLQRALIYFGGSEDSERVYSTGFVLTVALGCALAVLLFLLAPPLSVYFDAPEVQDYLYALAAYFAIGGLGIVPDAVMRQRLDFRGRFWPETSAPVARSASSTACRKARGPPHRRPCAGSACR